LKRKKVFRFLISSIALAAVCLAMAESMVVVSTLMVRSPLRGLENQIVDLAFQIRHHNPSFSKYSTDSVVIVDIDDQSIERLGRPQMWPRAYDAQVIAHIAEGHPAGIGIDYLYTETDEMPTDYVAILESRGITNATDVLTAMSTDEMLGNAIFNAENVYLSFYDDDKLGESEVDSSVHAYLRPLWGIAKDSLKIPALLYPQMPIAVFAEGAKGIGSISMNSMQDGTVRNYQLVHKFRDRNDTVEYVSNFPFYMYIDQLGLTDDQVRVTPEGVHVGMHTNIPLHEDGTFRINWLGSEDEIRRIPYFKVLAGRMPSDFFTGKTVLFGTSASGLQDLKTVPCRSEKMPGVEVHAVAFLNMMNNAYIHEVSERDALPYFIGISFLLVMLFFVLRPLFGFIFSVALIVVEMCAFVLWFLPTYNTVFPIVTLMLLTFFAYLASSLYIYFIREKKSRQLKNAFGSYVSPEVVEQIIKDSSALDLGGEKKELTILFSDIRGFTTISEQMDPQKIVAVLNEYLSQMSDVIFKHKGTIDKFIGDAIMTIFGAPISQKDHADRGCRVALDMVSSLEEFNKAQEAAGEAPLQIGIGLNTGEMTVGNIGSAKRFDYTVIGDAVNLGSRLESLTKYFGVDILVSESTKQACTTDEFVFRELAAVKVKGKDNAVIVYQLVGRKNEVNRFGTWLETWDKAMQSYKAQDLSTALSLFELCEELQPKDVTVHYYLDLCREYMSHPEKFTVVFKMESK
jgi:adenylate cyclase